LKFISRLDEASRKRMHKGTILLTEMRLKSQCHHKPALATVCALTLTPTVAIGACNMTLRGDLVPGRDPKRYPTTPQRMLFFTSNEIIEETGQRMAKHFQSFSFESATMSFPIPFALDIDSPRDCQGRRAQRDRHRQPGVPL
jgi:hypothetical protein